jgi:hypothetical protein
MRVPPGFDLRCEVQQPANCALAAPNWSLVTLDKPPQSLLTAYPRVTLLCYKPAMIPQLRRSAR